MGRSTTVVRFCWWHVLFISFFTKLRICISSFQDCSLCIYYFGLLWIYDAGHQKAGVPWPPTSSGSSAVDVAKRMFSDLDSDILFMLLTTQELHSRLEWVIVSLFFCLYEGTARWWWLRGILVGLNGSHFCSEHSDLKLRWYRKCWFYIWYVCYWL